MIEQLSDDFHRLLDISIDLEELKFGLRMMELLHNIVDDLLLAICNVLHYDNELAVSLEWIASTSQQNKSCQH